MDDWVKVWIDGQKRGEATLNNDKTFEVELTAGDHAIRVDLFEAVGEAILKIQWKLPGGTERCDVPAEALWHDPFKKEEYEKP